MGVSPMKRLRSKNPEIFGPADENVGKSRAGRPCHLRVLPPFVSDRETSRHLRIGQLADNEELLGGAYPPKKAVFMEGGPSSPA